jgi:hypothetical protein
MLSTRWCWRPATTTRARPPEGQRSKTVVLERNNGQQRHWTAALRRCSIVVSKSRAMIERRVTLFAHLHVNKEAAPEMYRLPIEPDRLFAIN